MNLLATCGAAQGDYCVVTQLTGATPLSGSRFGFLFQCGQECEHVHHLLLGHGVGQILGHQRQAAALARQNLRRFQAQISRRIRQHSNALGRVLGDDSDYDPFGLRLQPPHVVLGRYTSTWIQN